MTPPVDEPGEEHVTLTTYERRQFELIEWRFAIEYDEPLWARQADALTVSAKPLWIAVVITCAGIAMLGAIAASGLLVLASSAGAVAGLVMHCRSRRRPDTNA